MTENPRKFYVNLLQEKEQTVGHIISFDPPGPATDLNERTEKAPEIKSAEAPQDKIQHFKLFPLVSFLQWIRIGNLFH